MKKPMNLKIIYRRGKVLKVILMVGILFVYGCSGNYGRLAVSNGVEMQIENYEILSDHNYYYTESRARPRALIGIQESYTLQSRLWVPVELTSEQLKGWVDYLGFYAKYIHTNEGSDILDENGKKIGVWYAFIDWKDWAAVKMIDEGTVSVSAPINFGVNRRTRLH